jgi:hypothetical protein
MFGNKKRNIIIAAIALVVLIGGTIAGICIFNSKNKKDDKSAESGTGDNTKVEATTDLTTEDVAISTTEKITENTTEKSTYLTIEKTTENTTENKPIGTESADTSDRNTTEKVTETITEKLAEDNSGEQTHVHNWKTETYYSVEKKTVHHDEVSHVVHHDAVTHTEEQTHWVNYTDLGIYELPGCDLEASECPCPGHHDGCWVCHYCGQTFPTVAAINRHYEEIERMEIDNIATHEDLGNGMHRYTYKDMELQASIEEHLCWGYQGSSGWDDQKLVTETVTVVDKEAYDETIVDNPAWDEIVEMEVPHTREVCSECGAVR